MHIDGGGLVEGTHIYFHAINCTIDPAGQLSASASQAQPHFYFHLKVFENQGTHLWFVAFSDERGYRVSDGTFGSHSSYNTDAFGRIINPGMGFTTSTWYHSGGGHGGSGGRDQSQSRGGLAYDDIYEPDEFGSSGGGTYGGRGGGRIWINVTNTLHIDGIVSADGGDAGINGGHSGGGGAGGSIWIHTNVLAGYGTIQTLGGDGSGYVSGNDIRTGGGGGGGRIALYMQENITFSEFNFEVYGGAPGHVATGEYGGSGTAFVYHLQHEHRTLIVDNNGNAHPRNQQSQVYPYIDFENADS